MTSRDMHYDFKLKLNEIDSQKWRGLKVPEIDWKLNEAQELLAQMITEPRIQSQLGFEMNRRTIDDIRTIVVDQKPANYIVATVYDTKSFIVNLPIDYWFLINAVIVADKDCCKDIVLYDSKEVQHDDGAEISPFDKSSFEWRVSNYRFNKEGLRIFTDGTYKITKVGFEYLKRPIRIHNAASWTGGTYKLLDGTVLTGTQDCELPVGIHREVVDLAVFITVGDLNLPSYQAKQNKLRLYN